jgi:hypothetical protein
MEGKLTMLIGEIDKLNKVIIDKGNENEQWRRKCFDFERYCNEQ